MDDKRQAPEVTLESMQVRGASLMLRAAGHFAWQRGYGAFSVGPADLDALRGYIDDQEKHHQTRTFQEEFRAFLSRYGIDIDERYVWD